MLTCKIKINHHSIPLRFPTWCLLIFISVACTVHSLHIWYTVFEFTIYVCKIHQIICMRQMCRPLLAWHMAKWQRDPTSLFQVIHLKIALLYTYPKRCRQVQSEFCMRLYRGYSGFKYIPLIYPITYSCVYIYIYIDSYTRWTTSYKLIDDPPSTIEIIRQTYLLVPLVNYVYQPCGSGSEKKTGALPTVVFHLWQRRNPASYHSPQLTYHFGMA